MKFTRIVLSKSQRLELKQKYDGLCSYCGCVLSDRWHVDHIVPIIRIDQGECLNASYDTYDNLTPSCPSCNIIKGSNPLESFRSMIEGFIKSLNRDSTQYKFAKKYGLLKENEIKVVFHFEKYLK